MVEDTKKTIRRIDKRLGRLEAENKNIKNELFESGRKSNLNWYIASTFALIGTSASFLITSGYQLYGVIFFGIAVFCLVFGIISSQKKIYRWNNERLKKN